MIVKYDATKVLNCIMIEYDIILNGKSNDIEFNNSMYSKNKIINKNKNIIILSDNKTKVNKEISPFIIFSIRE